MSTKLSASEFATKLGISTERVRQLCKAGRICGAELFVVGSSSIWMIPEKAPDPRLKNGRPSMTFLERGEASMKQWTQDEAIAFECAREVITDMMAIWSARIAEESTREFPNKIRLLEMRTSRSNLAKERVALRVLDHGEISRIRDEYGAIVRAWRVEHHAVAV